MATENLTTNSQGGAARRNRYTNERRTESRNAEQKLAVSTQGRAMSNFDQATT